MSSSPNLLGSAIRLNPLSRKRPVPVRVRPSAVRRERETLNPYVENELRKLFKARRNSGVIKYVGRHVS